MAVRERTVSLAKVATSPAVLASLGASFANLANITSGLVPKVPPTLQGYLDASTDYFSTAVSTSNTYVQNITGLSPATVYSTVAGVVALTAIASAVSKKSARSRSSAIVVTTPTTSKTAKNKKKKAAKKAKDKANNTEGMRRYVWSDSHPALSPYTTSLSQDGVPDVTDRDYEYITASDIHNREQSDRDPFDLAPTGSRSGGSYFRPPDEDALDDIPQDDVLLFRHGNRVDKEHFPAYSIGDGKLRTYDVRDRVQLVYDLSHAQTERAKLYYKGKLLKNEDEPMCVAGVKNNSEILVVLDGDSASSSPKTSAHGNDSSKPKPKAKSRRQDRSPLRTDTSPPPSKLEVPARGRPGQTGGSPVSRSPSVGSSVPSVPGVNLAKIAPPTVVGSPMEKLDAIAAHFESKLQPLCEHFISNTPSDKKKREDDHNKISETIMQHIILKLDGVETNGDLTARAKRKALVTHVQDVLKLMDGRVKNWQ